MVQGLIRFFIEKSTLNHIFLIFLLILASFAYKSIPKEIFPSSQLDAVVISGGYAGASPDILDKMAVHDIEDALKGVSEIGEIESVIRSGNFTIKAYVKDGFDVDDAVDEAKDVIATLKRNLPSDMNEPTAKAVKHGFPLVIIALATDESEEQMLEVADKLKGDISRINHLSSVAIRGDRDKELLFKIDEKKITAYGLDLSQTLSALSSLSSIFPLGEIEQKGNHIYLSTQNGEKDIAKINSTILSIGGKRIRLGDIATAAFTLSDSDQLSSFNGRPNISIDVQKSDSGNAIALVKEIKTLLNTYQQNYAQYDFEVYTDTSVWIRNRLNTVISNIIFGLILVSLSVFIFVNARIAFVVAIGIPVSFMIGLISAEMMGYSLNMLSLLGALIALGMLVDEAIVVAENIYRHLENGEDAKSAAIKGASEMFPAVLTATATTIFAFLPLLIMSGEMGMFIKILPIMIAILLLSSLIEAFVFLPLHSYEFLKVESKKGRGSTLMDRITQNYEKAIRFLLRHRIKAVVLFLLFTLLSIVVLAKHSKFQLFPDFDTTQVYISGQVNINNALEDTQQYVREIETILLDSLPKSEVSSITSVVGMKLNAKNQPLISSNNFHIFVNLYERKPQNVFDTYINPILSPEYDESDMKRELSAKEVETLAKEALSELQSSTNYEEFKIFVPGAGIVKSDIEIALSGDTEKLKHYIPLLKTQMQGVEGAFNISSDLIEGKKELKLTINDYGQSLGFSEQSVAALLKPLFLRSELSKMFYNGELIDIVSEASQKDTIKNLESLYIDIPGTFQKVRLSDVALFKYQEGYAEIYKDDGERISTISGSLDKQKITSSEFLSRIETMLQTVRDDGVRVEIKGEERENKRIQQEMMQAAIIAMFLIFIALVWMFDSIILSLVVLSTIPLAVLGVLFGNIIMGLNMTMPGMLGVVGLSGVVVNDGIIMIDFIKKANSEKEFIQKAMMRLRPILLTSITTILGLSTLIFFASGQALILQPMAVSLGFGLAWATVLNLLFVPVLYSAIYRKKLNG
jgi:multidrug efflux pump subunit AcrB